MRRTERGERAAWRRWWYRWEWEWRLGGWCSRVFRVLYTSSPWCLLLVYFPGGNLLSPVVFIITIYIRGHIHIRGHIYTYSTSSDIPCTSISRESVTLSTTHSETHPTSVSPPEHTPAMLTVQLAILILPIDHTISNHQTTTQYHSCAIIFVHSFHSFIRPSQKKHSKNKRISSTHSRSIHTRTHHNITH